MTDGVFLVAMGVLLLASATCSGSETALFSLNPGQVVEAGRRDSLGRLVARLLDAPERLLLVILIANNAINITYFALASLWASGHGGEPVVATTLTLGAIAAIILFGEILPKIVAARRSELCARLAAPPMWGLGQALAPVCQVTEAVLSRLGIDADEPRQADISADELKLVLDHSLDHGVVTDRVHERLVEIVDLAGTPAFRVMTHRLDCCTVGEGADHAAMVAALRDKPAPLILVLDDDEHCTGVLHAQDLLRGERGAKKVRRPLFVPEAANLAQVLRLFQEQRATAGVVVDEYGGTAGLVTLAHLGVELLGAGRSEDLPGQPRYQAIDEHTWILSGTMPLEQWRPLLGDDPELDDCTTIAGLLSKQKGSIPVKGDRLFYRNLLFTVEETDGLRVASVRMRQLSPREARRVTAESWP